MKFVTMKTEPRCASGTAQDDRTLDEKNPATAFRSYVAGIVIAGLLTAAAFLVAWSDVVYGPGKPVALLVLAVAQMGVHLVFFLHLNSAPGNAHNLLALGFGLLIVLLVIVGSLWIMSNLSRNMPSMDPMQQMDMPT